MNDISVLIKALRCSTTVPAKGHSCEGCKYRGLNEYDPAIPVLYDVEIDGVSYWGYCDTEKMAIDAADILEEVLIYEDDRK